VTFISALKELWSRKLLVALALVIALAAAIVAVYHVNPSGPTLSKRSTSEARGESEILVDSARSPIADSRRDLAGLSARAGVFARLMAGGNVIRQIAEDTGIPENQIDVVGPTPLPGEAPGAGELAAPHPYGISFTQSGELPIVGVETRAPTVKEAQVLAAAAPGAVREVVESVQAQQGTPAAKRVEFRVLGPAQAELVDDALGKKAVLLLFLVALSFLLLAILGLPRFIDAWRNAEPELLPEEPRPLPGEESPGVVHLPAGRAGEAGPDSPQPTWIEQRREP
jgi:hypothetical protein